MEKNFEFNKVDDGHYAFVMKTDDIERTEVVSKQFAKDHYNEIKAQKIEHMRNLSKVNHDLETNNVPKDDELEHFIRLANNAAKYKKFMDAQASRDAIVEMLEGINKSMTLMEQQIPELKRMPEK